VVLFVVRTTPYLWQPGLKRVIFKTPPIREGAKGREASQSHAKRPGESVVEGVLVTPGWFTESSFVFTAPPMRTLTNPEKFIHNFLMILR
jgi:hypothetical protein